MGNTGRISAVDLQSGSRRTFATIAGLDNRAGFDDGGLHTLAFHPDYEQNGLFYVSWVDDNSLSRVDQFEVDQNGVVGAPSTVISYPALGTRAGRHSIGWIGFKPNAQGDERNNLYITTGEGGFPEGSSSYANVSQDLGTPYGKVLRVEVGTGVDLYPDDDAKNFGIPISNPYVRTAGALGEVFHSGLRNPWRASFDRDSGDMFIGDVGWLTLEEIDFARDGESGLDFGWSRREGTIATPGGSSPDIGGPLGDSINPIYEYGRDEGVSTVGGYVYRGPIEELRGRYFFADTVSGRVWSAESFDRDTLPTTYNGDNLSGVAEITGGLRDSLQGDSINNVVSFGEDHLGNVYLVRIGDGGPAGSVSGTGELFRLTVPRAPDPDSRTDIFLLVDPISGAVQLRNQSGIDVAFDAYTMQSASGALLPDTWLSLEAADDLSDGWRESNPSSTQLAELLQVGEYVLRANQLIHFGSILDVGTAAEDVEFFYLAPGSSRETEVPVVYAPLTGDADINGDGFVDGIDYALWRGSLGDTGISLPADVDRNGVVDRDDLLAWKSSFGRAASVSNEVVVPEPLGVFLGFIGLALAASVGASSRVVFEKAVG